MSLPKITKARLLELIDELAKNPQDKVRILGDAGITIIGGGLGAAAVGTFASAAGLTSIFGVTTAAGWLGVTAVAATPLGWVLGGGALAGAAAYGVARHIRSGGLAEGRKAELLQKYREDAKDIEAKEASKNIAAKDQTLFIVSLRELIDKNVIPPEKAFKLIEQVERGGIPLSQALNLIQSLLQEVPLNEQGRDAGKPTSAGQAKGPRARADAAASAPNTKVEPAKGKLANDLVRSAASNLKAWGDAISETGAGLMTKAESGAAAVTIAASDVASAVDGTAGKVKTLVTDWFQEAPIPAQDGESPAAVDPMVTSKIEQMVRDVAPVIWLLGKTGAGKSSVIAKLTGATHAEVGNGFVSCTRTAQLFQFPQEMPLLRFLDTRGLGEPGYDPTEDIAWSHSQAHLILVVMKAGDPSQEEVLAAVKAIRKAQPDWPMLVVQTGLHDLYSPDDNNHPAAYPFNGTDGNTHVGSVPRQLRNALDYQRALFSKIQGGQPLFVPVDFTQESDSFDPHDFGKAALIDGILTVAPESVRLLIRMKLEQELQGASGKRMQQLNMRILYWAAGAAAVGAAPVVGLVTVPVAQAAMLAQLATIHGVKWEWTDVTALSGMLGAAIVANQCALLAIRQFAKIGPWVIPIAAAQDYAVTFALGRAACIYLQARQDNTAADSELVKKAFHEGLKQAFMASEKKVSA